MSYATPVRPVVGDQRVQRALARQEERGNDPDVKRILAKHLAANRGLSAQVVNKYNDGKYPAGRHDWIPDELANRYGVDDDLDERYGRGSAANLAGLKGAQLGKGDVYMGATAIEVPRVTRQTPNAGESVVEPGSTRYDITVLPRWMVQQRAAGSAAAPNEAADAPTDPTPLQPPEDLLVAREAYDRANAYQSQGGSTASLADLSKVGGDLFNSIQGAAQDQIDDYERRFLPQLYANANLTAKEIGYATRDALAGLPDNLALPEYGKVFPTRASKKGGLYPWLEGRIA